MVFFLKKGNGKNFKLHTVVAVVLPVSSTCSYADFLIFPKCLKIIEFGFYDGIYNVEEHQGIKT